MAAKSASYRHERREQSLVLLFQPLIFLADWTTNMGVFPADPKHALLAGKGRHSHNAASISSGVLLLPSTRVTKWVMCACKLLLVQSPPVQEQGLILLLRVEGCWGYLWGRPWNPSSFRWVGRVEPLEWRSAKSPPQGGPFRYYQHTHTHTFYSWWLSFNPSEKYAQVIKLDHFPQKFRGENSKKTCGWNHPPI